MRDERGDAIADVIHVEVQKSALGPNDEHVRLALVLGMPCEIREIGCPWDPPNLHNARTRGTAEEEKIEMITPMRTPWSSPAPRTPRSAAMATANSVRLKRQMLRSASTWMSPVTAISTTAARTGWGRSRNSPVKKSTTTSMMSAATSPESGVRAPPVSLTSDCDMPPLTGSPLPRPATRFALPIARNSCVASSRYPCLAENIRPIAVVSTAASTKHAMASGRIS